MADIKKLPLFVRCVIQNFPFIEEDFDALTNYQLTSKVVEYLNKVTNSQNEVISVANNLQEAFVQLQTYVNDYFDNLDVQEEINNKLDAMVEAGTLQEIIDVYLQSTAYWGFDNVASMKASTNLVDGSYAKTLGFYAKNDGGAATYKIRELGNDETADEKFLIAIGSDGLVAELITDDLVNICQVGGQQNFSTVCNTVLTAGKSVYVPDKDFTADSTIIVNSDNVKFICDGNIEFTTENSTFFSIQNQRAIVKFNKKVTCPTNSVAIEVCGGNHQVRYSEVFVHYVYSCSIGILINPNGGTGASANTFKWDRINASEAGIKLATGNTSANWANSNFFFGGQLSAPYGIVTRKGTAQTDAYNGNVFDHIMFDGNPTITIALDLQFCKHDWFTNLRISENRGGTYDYQLDACSYLQIENFSFINIDRVNILNPLGLSYPNFFKCSYIRDSGDHWLSNECMELNGKFILTGQLYNPNLAKLEAADDNTTFTLPDFYNDGMVVKIGAQTDNQTYEYSLPDIFDRRGIKDFYIYVSNKPQNTRLRVFRSNGTTNVIEFKVGTDITKGLYHIHDYGYAYTDAPTTKVTKVELYTGS